MTRKSFLRVASVGAAAYHMRAVPGLAALSEAAATKGRRITGIDVGPLTIPIKGKRTVALAARVTAENVLVRLRTSEGAVGYGESSPYPPVMSETQASDLALSRPLAALLRDRDPFTLPQLVDAMLAYSPNSTGIIAAFEMALWDLCGRIAGLPVYRLLGAARDSFETDCTVYLDPPDVMAENAVGIVRAGFPAVKVKLGQAPALDVERVHAIRAAVGPDVPLRADANQGWSVAHAIQVLRQTEPYGLEFCEQPVKAWDWQGLREVRADAPVPIMADEAIHSPHDALEGLRLGAFDMINIKLMKTGGILQAARIAAIAHAADVPCMVGCMNETRLGLTAAAHFVMSQRIVHYADLDSNIGHEVDPCNGGLHLERGVVTVPDTPGLGVDIEPTHSASLQAVG